MDGARGTARRTAEARRHGRTAAASTNGGDVNAKIWQHLPCVGVLYPSSSRLEKWAEEAGQRALIYARAFSHGPLARVNI